MCASAFLVIQTIENGLKIDRESSEIGGGIS